MTRIPTTLDALHENLSDKNKILILAKDMQDAASKARELMLEPGQWRYLRTKNSFKGFDPKQNVVCTTHNFHRSIKSQEIMREASKKGFTVV